MEKVGLVRGQPTKQKVGLVRGQPTKQKVGLVEGHRANRTAVRYINRTVVRIPS